MGRLKRAKARVGPLLWRKAMSEEENKKTVVDEKDKDKSESIRKASDSQLLVAALVATVSFAAAFTLPGGYDDKNCWRNDTQTLFKHCKIDNKPEIINNYGEEFC